MLVDVRATLPPGFDPAAFEKARDALRDELSAAESEPIASAPGRIAPGNPDSPPTDAFGVRGVLFRSEDRKRVAQFRTDGFTFNQLAPYPGWKAARADAIRFLDVYLDLAMPLRLTRIAIRFINRMELPANLRRLATRFVGIPEVPSGSPRELVHYVQRTVTRDEKSGMVAIVAQSIERPTRSGHGALLLDIHAFMESGAGFERSTIDSRLDELRRVKNRIFFSFITERTAKEYE
jgi:uncharacterized protein (TIGR04255 family)